MKIDQKQALVDQLAELASDPSTGAWSSRVYIAAALWLESELVREGAARGDPKLTIAAERVQKRDAGEMPIDFKSFVRAWLGDVRGNI